MPDDDVNVPGQAPAVPEGAGAAAAVPEGRQRQTVGCIVAPQRHRFAGQSGLVERDRELHGERLGTASLGA